MSNLTYRTKSSHESSPDKRSPHSFLNSVPPEGIQRPQPLPASDVHEHHQRLPLLSERPMMQPVATCSPLAGLQFAPRPITGLPGYPYPSPIFAMPPLQFNIRSTNLSTYVFPPMPNMPQMLPPNFLNLQMLPQQQRGGIYEQPHQSFRGNL